MALRVLQIVTQMERNGLETMLMNYYRNIDRSKVQFDFLVHRQERKDYDDEIELLGGKIYRMQNLNPFSVSYYKDLGRFFDEHPEYHIVHSHLDCMAGIPLGVAKKHHVPFRIAHSHNSNQVKNLKYPLKLVFKKNIPHNANRLFACSEEAGQWMFGKHPFHVLHNAIDAGVYRWNSETRLVRRKEFGITDDAIVIGHVGRFLTQKNHTYLLDIFNSFCKTSERDAFLLLIGVGELIDEIRKKADTLGILERVIFAGLRTDVYDVLQAMDVFVMPSLFEGLPLVLVEAQAAGLPCVISDQVPPESIKVEGLVDQVSLKSSPVEWSSRIEAALKIPRRDTYKDIIAADFDIHANAKKLQKYYLALGNKGSKY